MMDAYELFGDELDYLGPRVRDWDSRGYEDVDDDEPPRCELDSDNGGVCLKRLRADGSCPTHGSGEEE